MMELKHPAAAGTLESSDILITVTPGSCGVEIDLTSSVELYYGSSIRAAIGQVLEELDVTDVHVEAVDHGALECTIRARVAAAVKRACREEAK